MAVARPDRGGAAFPVEERDGRMSMGKARAVLVDLYKRWARETQDPARVRECYPRTRFVVFERMRPENEERVPVNALGVLPDSDRAKACSASRNPLYCVGCASRCVRKEGAVCLRTRVEMLGFICEGADAIRFAPPGT